MSQPPDEKTLAMVREAASLMGKLFIARRDRKAVFRPDHKGNWHWTAVADKFTMDDFVNHLTGTHCLGTYLLDADSMVKFLAFDIDLNKKSKYLEIYSVERIEEMTAEGVDWDQYGTSFGIYEGNLEAALHDTADPAHRWARVCLLGAIRTIHKAVTDNLKLPSMTVITGGGAHVLVPLPELTPAIDARSVGLEIMSTLPSARRRNEIFFDYGGMGEIAIEVFPKQDRLTDDRDYGNLIRLPFGWHYEAAMRTYTIDPDAPAVPNWEWSKTKSMGTLRALAQASGAA